MLDRRAGALGMAKSGLSLVVGLVYGCLVYGCLDDVDDIRGELSEVRDVSLARPFPDPPSSVTC